jgi:hypothetical protein
MVGKIVRLKLVNTLGVVSKYNEKTYTYTVLIRDGHISGIREKDFVEITPSRNSDYETSTIKS